MTIKINLSKKIDEELQTEYLEIQAETSHEQKPVTFYINGNHMATTMTDDTGCISAGTSIEDGETYLFEVECEGEREGVKYKNRR